MLSSILHQLFPNIIATIRILVILSTIIFISTLVILGIIQDKDKYRRQLKYPEVKQEELNEENKLLLLTKFNTIINKHMPDEICDYIKGTYDRIYGSDSHKYYPKALLPQGKIKKKLKRKVSFSDEINQLEFEI